MKKLLFLFIVMSINTISFPLLEAVKKGKKARKSSCKKIKKSYSCNLCEHAPFTSQTPYNEHVLNRHGRCCDCDYAIAENKQGDYQSVYKLARHLAKKHARNAVYFLRMIGGGKPSIMLRTGRAIACATSHSKKGNVFIDEREFHVHANQELQCSECEKFLDESYYDEHYMRMHIMCPWCKEPHPYQTIGTLVKHIQESHPDKDFFSCDDCLKFISLDQDLLILHQQDICFSKKKKHNFRCTRAGCSCSFKKKESADHHMVHVHYQCHVCDNFKINTSNPSRKEVEQLAQHIDQAHGRIVYLCPAANCSCIGIHGNLVSRHAQTHGQQAEVTRYRFTGEQDGEEELCNDIQMQPASPSRTMDDRFICNRANCDESFSKKETCLNHIIGVHQGCPSCGFDLTQEEDIGALAHHLSTAHPPKYSTVYVCPAEECRFIALDSFRAQRHNSGKHKGKIRVQKYEASISSTDIEDLRKNFSPDEIFAVPVWCWLKRWTANASQESSVISLKHRYCNQELVTETEVMEHFQSVHTICFTCLKKNALFKTTQSLLKHIKNAHPDKTQIQAKCPDYMDKKVCVHCCNVLKYESEDLLMAHIHDKHPASLA